jgi:uncharacterized HAD superfamily protein
MKIGIDVDGVLTDMQGFNNRNAPRFFALAFNRSVVNENANDIRDMFNCQEKEYKAYWKKYLLRYVIFEPARKGAKTVIRKLHDNGNEIFIISKRVFTCRDDFMGKLMRFLLRNWLCRNGIKYDEIVFCDTNVLDSKRIVCMEKHIDVMIDDEPVNIETIAPITKVICFDTSYNQECEGENIMRAREWGEIEDLMKI